MPNTVETAIPSLSASARSVQWPACSGGGGIESSIVSPAFSFGTGLAPVFPRMSRSRQSTPSARKWSRQRRTVGFDMPVARIVCDRAGPSPRQRTMLALWTCLRIDCGLVLIRSRCSRSSLPGTIRVLLLFAILALLAFEDCAAFAGSG